MIVEFDYENGQIEFSLKNITFFVNLNLVKKLNIIRKSLSEKDDGTVGWLIRYYRLSDGLTQAALAKHLRIRPSQLNEIEKNKRTISLEVAVKTAKLLKFPSEIVIERWMKAKILNELGEQYAVICLKGMNDRDNEDKAYARHYGSLLTALDRIRESLVAFDIKAALEIVVLHLRANRSLLSNIDDLKKRDTIYKVLSNLPEGINPTVDTLQILFDTLRTVNRPNLKKIGKTLVQR